MGIVRQIYFYSICLVTLIMMIGGGIAFANHLSDIVFPNGYYQSYEDYKRIVEYEMLSRSSIDNQNVVMNEAQLRANYEAEKKENLEREIRYAKNSLTRSLAWVIIPLPFFLWAGRIIRKEKV